MPNQVPRAVVLLEYLSHYNRSNLHLCTIQKRLDSTHVVTGMFSLSILTNADRLRVDPVKK